MIDYVTLMLANMAAGLIVLASFVIWGLDHTNRKAWAPAFAAAGLVATVCGLVMTFTWPLPKPYSMAFGETSVLFGVLLLGAAGALTIGADLQPLGIYAAFPGVVAILIGVRIMQLSLTGSPKLAGIGFILTGASGLGAWITVRQRQVRVLRYAGAAILLGAAAIWTLTALLAYWYHMAPPASS